MISCDNDSFYITTQNSSYIMKISPDGVLIHCYYGKRISAENMDFYNLYIPYDYTAPYTICNGETTLDALPQECPSFGRGDYRLPAIIIQNKGGREVNDFRYISYCIHNGSIKTEGLPCLDCSTEFTETLEIIMNDIVSGAEIHLYYTVFEEIDVIARHTQIMNKTDNTIVIKKIASSSLDFENSNFDMVSLYGRWANERTLERFPLHHGKTVISSNRGSSGHHTNPFVALAERNADESNGNVYAVSLIYSGNFEISIEVNQFGNTRLFAGISAENFSWELPSGENFVSPQAVLTYSCEGFGKMSRNFHTMCRSHLGVCSKNKKHPIVLNMWEAFYFSVTEKNVIETIDEVANFGIDTVVLDDGWFGHRQNEESSLGDWFVNNNKFPSGLGNIIELCKEKGLKFGLWFEPEMISPESKLYKKHPDWCIHIPGVEPIRSRCELVLDFSRSEVVDYVYDSLSRILNEYDISYVKWDMNRNITDNGSIVLPENRQGEHAHRHMLGVYRLMEMLKNKFPDIFFEGSAGGGGRFDLGLLYYMSQIWTSDNSDAIGRLKIQYGTSMVYPPETISCHVSVCPNHQTNRVTPFTTRGDVAQLFSFGYEFDPKKLLKEDRKLLLLQVAKHREFEKWLPDSDFYRLINPADGDCCAWQSVSKDKTHSAVLFIVQLTQPKMLGSYLRLKGLDVNKKYCVVPLNVIVPGDVLMYAGLPIRRQYNDFESLLFEITEVL